ncbi:MAG: hypothetical protein MH137_08335 [Flavobacteriales bacterium]|nr:hypothetical protein [Flavobacteriales bacterium]
MRRIENINIDQSVKRQKLVFEEDWFDKLDRIFIYLFTSGFVVYPLLAIKEADFSNINDKFISLTIFPMLIVFGIYVIYRKATEKRLMKINTPFDRQKNRQILLDYAKQQQLEIFRSSKECLIFNEPVYHFNSLHKKSIVIMVLDNVIYFTVLVDRFRFNLPTMIFHHVLKYDLKKLMSEQRP